MVIHIKWNDKDKTEFDLDLRGNMTIHPLVIETDNGEIIVNRHGTCEDDAGFHGTWTVKLE